MMKLLVLPPLAPERARHAFAGLTVPIVARRQLRARAPADTIVPLQRAAFLDALAAGLPLERALAAAEASLEALVRLRRRDRGFDRRWQDVEAAGLVQIASLMQAHCIRQLAHPGAGPGAPSEAMLRHSMAVGQWLLEKRLPARSSTPCGRATKAGADASAAAPKPVDYRQLIADAERRLREAEAALREA